MIGDLKIACVIPARLESTRLPRKVLRRIGDKSMLQHVWESAQTCSEFDFISFAVDAHETGQLVQSFGGSYQMTSKQCQNGTRRVIEFMGLPGVFDADIWVIWQGDEPFVRQKMVSQLLSRVYDDRECQIWTLMAPITDVKDIDDPAAVKVVVDHAGKALYFSRASIPFARDGRRDHVVKKHIGMYAFSKHALNTIRHLSPSPLEEIERLEQLTFLYHGLSMRVLETEFATMSIDTEEDLQKAVDKLSLT